MSDIKKILSRMEELISVTGVGGTLRVKKDDLIALVEFASVLAEQGEPEWEYGVEYEISDTESVFTAAHSEAMARKWVEESPSDTGLRRRLPAGPWLEV